MQHPLPSLHDCNMKIPDETFVEDGNRRKHNTATELFFPFLNRVPCPRFQFQGNITTFDNQNEFSCNN